MFNLNDYETVATRLEKFWKEYPDGRVETEIVRISPDNKQFICKASIYKTFADSVPFATGFAEEIVSVKGVNASSALENCETSAIGRALANGNISSQAGGIAKGQRASREEIEKVTRYEEAKKDPWGIAPQAQAHAPEPKTLADGITIVEEILGGEPAIPEAPHCDHGVMKMKQGTKNGKPYLGWVCDTWIPEMPDSMKCKAVWARLMGNHWVIPKGAE